MAIEKEEFELTDEQKDIVESGDGPMLVNAGPGSGKTVVVVHRVQFLIKQGVDPRDILLISFSRSAREKLQSQINSLIDIERRSHITIKTFHALALEECEKILQPTRVDIMPAAEIGSIIKKLSWMEEFNFKILKTTSKKISDTWFQSFNSYFKQRIATECVPKQYQTTLSKEQEFYQQMKNIKLINLGNDYCRDGVKSELLEEVVKKFKNPDSRRTENGESWMFDEWLSICIKSWQLSSRHKKFLYVFVDEFQDTNTLQYSFLNYLCKGQNSNKNLCCIGDLDQSIYSFSGAYPKIFDKFLEDFQPNIEYQLVKKIEINKRSSKKIIDISQKLINHIPINKDFAKDIKPCPSNNVDNDIEWIDYVDNENHQPVLEELKKIVDKMQTHDPNAKLSEIAILSPTINNTYAEPGAFIENIRRELDIWAGKKICQLWRSSGAAAYDDEKFLWLLFAQICAFDPQNRKYKDLFDCMTEVFHLINVSEKERQIYQKYFDDYLREEKKNKFFFNWYKEKNNTITDAINFMSDFRNKNLEFVAEKFHAGIYEESTLELTSNITAFDKKIKDALNSSIFQKQHSMSHWKLGSLAKIITKTFKDRPHNSLFKKLSDASFRVRESYEKEDDLKIQMMSIHKSKGKEFKYVFIVNLKKNSLNQSIVNKHYWDYLETHYDDASFLSDSEALDKEIDKWSQNIKSADGEDKDNQEKIISILEECRFQWQESIRKLYVGITRAKEYLYVCFPGNNKSDLIALIKDDVKNNE